MYAIIGIVVGLAIYRLIITPILRKKSREKCIRDGLVPRDMAQNRP